MIYGYARCSTSESKQDIDRQRRELKKMGATDQTIYFEYESGAKTDRVELMKLLSMVEAGDTLVTTEISRLTRSTKHLCELIDFAKEKKINIVVQNSITVHCSHGELDPMTAAFVQMSGVFAELERAIIRRRISSGMQHKKAKALAEGRTWGTKKRTAAADIPPTFHKHYQKWRLGQINKTELAKLTNLSRPTVNKYIHLIEETEKQTRTK